MESNIKGQVRDPSGGPFETETSQADDQDGRSAGEAHGEKTRKKIGQTHFDSLLICWISSCSS